MKICFISSGYPTKGRPDFVFVEQLVHELIRQGIEVDVIAPQSLTNHYLRKTPLLPKKNIITIGDRSYIVFRPYYVSLSNCPFFIQSLLEDLRCWCIKRILNRMPHKADVLYGHFWNNAYVVRKYATKNNVPVFVACGEGDNALENMVDSVSPKNKKLLTTAVKGVVSASSENKRKCIVYNLAKEEDIIVLPNSVDSALFDKPAQKDVRKDLGVSDSDFLIAYTGAFNHRKGSDRLAAAIEKLNDPKIKVLFIGRKRPGDDATPNCNGIVYIGELDHEKIPDYLKAADVFCLPTLNEGCSNAIVEAVVCGLPVVSSNLPFNQDILSESNAILVDPMSVEQIADAIKTLKDNKELIFRLSKGSKEMGASLNLSVRASKIIDFINSKTKL